MSPCRYGNDINKTIHFEKNWKNVARKLQRFCSVYFPGLKKYLMEKSKTVKSSTLWSTYSMLKLTLNIRDGIDVTKFLKLVPFLKKKSVCYQAKKSKVLTREKERKEKASDENYLLWKINIKFCYDKLYNLSFFRSF
jgi:hypothetical protein